MQTKHVILGAGPVGRVVAERLVDAYDVKPTVITRSGSDIPGTLSLKADLSSRETAADALAGADVVYQCSQPAYDRWPEEFPTLQNNITAAITGTNAVLVAAENM